jgi:hypothetical protein
MEIDENNNLIKLCNCPHEISLKHCEGNFQFALCGRGEKNHRTQTRTLEVSEDKKGILSIETWWLIVFLLSFKEKERQNGKRRCGNDGTEE